MSYLSISQCGGNIDHSGNLPKRFKLCQLIDANETSEYNVVMRESITRIWDTDIDMETFDQELLNSLLQGHKSSLSDYEFIDQYLQILIPSIKEGKVVKAIAIKQIKPSLFTGFYLRSTLGSFKIRIFKECDLLE